jgi:pimeloyl-ACP methyl ester carboxylesterase/tetratricopeptide (TPR) repeat protein
MPDTAKRKIIVRGLKRSAKSAPVANPRFAEIVDAKPRPGAGIDLSAARSSEAADHTLECADEDVVELHLEGGLCLYTSVDRLTREVIPAEQSRGRKKGQLAIPRHITFENQRSRGEDGILVEAVQVLDLKGKILDRMAEEAGAGAARIVAGWLESQLIGDGGLFRIEQIRSAGEDAKVTPRPVKIPEIDSTRPALVFVHGTASSTRGSFADLWSSDSDQIWSRLQKTYGDNILGFEHLTLTQSPIRNALDLVKMLPVGQTVHLISHSRGGLVGELLCRGQFSDGREPFTREDLELFNARDNSYLKRIFELGAEERDYAAQLKDLEALNDALKHAQLKIERFVRVACPARGTTLASGKLDIYLSTVLNVIGLIPALQASGIYDFTKALALAAAKQRTVPEALPGLEAQMPGSPLIALLNGTRSDTSAHLAVIAGDIEPSGFLEKMALFLVDRFYESDHDLIVNTPSMDGGGTRVKPVPVMKQHGDRVHHFSYFARRASRDGLLAALQDDGMPPGFFAAARKPVAIARSLPRGVRSGEAPVVFILPGISGSHIEVDGNRIWIDIWDLVRGKFTKLDISAKAVRPDGPVASAYGDLAVYLSRTHEVIPFAYDWRRSILDAASELAGAVDERLQNCDRPVRIIAHSMGGLVTRGMIAQHPEVWERMRARQGSRVLMLGTPNSGSYSIPRLLANQHRMIKWLARADYRNNAYRLLAIMSEFPGVLELMPVTEDGRFFKNSTWSQFTRILGREDDQPWQHPTSEALGRAAHTWDILNSVTFDQERVFYIAGRANETPAKMTTDGGKVRFLATSRGDGEVPWEGGIPEKVKHWFVDAIHGDLANHEPAFPAMLDILEQGQTHLLATRPPVSRDIVGPREMMEDTVDIVPSESMLAAAALGASPYGRVVREPAVPPVRVSVQHGNLRFSSSPIMVSHYKDDTIVSAEAELDRQMNGRLGELYRLGLYPGALETSEVLLNMHGSNQFPGAVVVGLGEVGRLNPGDLTRSLQKAFLRYATTVRENKEFDGHPIRLTALLIGTGSGGLALKDAVASMLRAVVRANRLLAGDTGNTDRVIEALQFTELYEDVAVQAQHCLRELADNPEFASRVVIDEAVKVGDGGRYRVSHFEDPNWWQRVRIVSTDDGDLEFTALTRRAVAPVRTLPAERHSVDPFIRSVMQSTSRAPRVGRALFEMLIPHDFKHYTRENRNLVIVVDEASAIYPWEMLEYSGEGGNEALALQAGLIRQLATPDNAVPNLCHNRRSLVIGDPVSDWPELAGAQAEAKTVAELLTEKYGDGTFLLRPTSTEVLTALMTDEYQVLHLSGHGAFEFDPAGHGRVDGKRPSKKPRNLTGMVIGNDQFLTPNLLRQMPATPEFVFINCCHLGRASDDRPEHRENRHRLAANLATQLIRQGVRAVIAAGWEVDDPAAKTFALRFYEALLSGASFGDAVLAARKATHYAHPMVDTWGAYQCYGDHGYKLDPGRMPDTGETAPQYVSLAECITDIRNIAEDAKTADELQTDRLRQRLRQIENTLTDEWRASGKLQLALGKAGGELDQFDRAIEAYQSAIRGEDGHGTINAVEQHANLSAREAVNKAVVARSLESAGQKAEAAKLFMAAQESIQGADEMLELLNKKFGATVERLNQRGSARKRSIMTMLCRVTPETHFRGRIVSELKVMGGFYQDAHELAHKKRQRFNVRALVNWLWALWLTNAFDRRHKFPADFDDLLQRAREAPLVPEIDREHFWNSVNEADCRILQSLRRDSLANDWREILAHYREIRKIAASPKQFRSVIEHLEFLRDATGLSKRPELSEQLDRLISGLMS